MTPWVDAIDRLRFLGYSIILDGERLRYIYQGKDDPPRAEIIPLLEVLKAHKAQALNDPYCLIEQTLREINQAYPSGLLAWIEADRPKDWGNMLALERSVNETALGGDLKGLREALSEYQGFILAMAGEFKAQREKGQGTLDFQSRKEMK